jgi:hypothetical protein
MQLIIARSGDTVGAIEMAFEGAVMVIIKFTSDCDTPFIASEVSLVAVLVIRI